MPEQFVGIVDELGPGSVRGIGDWAVLNVNGERYAVSRRCRHLRADLANGKIDEDGCLVCPWHQSRYDPATGRMVVGPQAGEVVPAIQATAPPKRTRHAMLEDELSTYASVPASNAWASFAVTSLPFRPPNW